jgi:hypothetical protein
MNEQMGARPWLAHTQEDYGRLLLARGAPGDAEKAHELLEECSKTSRELGMSALAERASALGESASVRTER